MKDRIKLTIRATNGASWETSHFSDDDRVDHVRKLAVEHFVREHVMVPGDYLVAVIEGGQARELPDSQSLEEVGVAASAVLALIARGPQTDG
jgi:hypothetical protein